MQQYHCGTVIDQCGTRGKGECTEGYIGCHHQLHLMALQWLPHVDAYLPFCQMVVTVLSDYCTRTCLTRGADERVVVARAGDPCSTFEYCVTVSAEMKTELKLETIDYRCSDAEQSWNLLLLPAWLGTVRCGLCRRDRHRHMYSIVVCIRYQKRIEFEYRAAVARRPSHTIRYSLR